MGRGEALAADEASAALAAQWERVVGPDVARRTRPARLRNGVLTVLTASPAWSDELSLHSPRIIEALCRAVPGAQLQRLRFSVASGRTTVLFDSQGPPTAIRVAARARLSAAAATPRPAEDAGALVARLAAQQPALDARRDRTGWRRCTQCGRRFFPALAPSEAGAALCAPCAQARHAAAAGAIERALVHAPWLSLDELRSGAPRTSRSIYERTRQRLLARWQNDVESARRRLRRDALTPDDRVAAWSYLMAASGLSQRDIGQAVVTDMLGREWMNALFGASAAQKQEARRTPREKHKR